MRRPGFYRLTATALVFSWILFLHSPSEFWAADLTIELSPDLDQIGSQIETVQTYEYGKTDWSAFGLYDTGASVVSISYLDQMYFDLLSQPVIPILTSNGTPVQTSAQGIDGALTGHVSQPGTIFADGIHALNMNDIANIYFDTKTMVQVLNVQTFVGTTGSSELPTITGTPIHNSGMAAKIDMQGFGIDFGKELGVDLTLSEPDLHFVAHNSDAAKLQGTTKTPTPLRIPLQLVGPDNYANPGNDVTAGPNPVVNNITLRQGLIAENTYSKNVTGKRFLFDTGAQVSLINESLAVDLGLTLQTPITHTQIQGAAGNPIDVYCYLLDSLELPRDDDGNGTIDATLKLTKAPIFVLDLTDFELDGILGTNLWNSVGEMLYDPTDPNNPFLSLTVSDTHTDQLTLDEMADMNAAFSDLLKDTPLAGLLQNLTTLYFPAGAHAVPEPSAWILLVMGMTGFLFHRKRSRKL